VPELPDVAVYVERLRALTAGQPIQAIRLASPFVLRTVTPAAKELVGATVETVERLGKRIVIGVTGERFIVIHLMIAGRLRWKEPRAKLPQKRAARSARRCTSSPVVRASPTSIAAAWTSSPRRRRSSASGCAASATR
jgi:formamidopyrimidine-DNA glycosylase